MIDEDRFTILRAGLDALLARDAELRAALPPPEREDPALLGELRALGSLVERLRSVAELADSDAESRTFRDAHLSMLVGPDDVALVRALATDRGVRSPNRLEAASAVSNTSLSAMATVLERYAAGEFMPPLAWFQRNPG